MENKKNGLEQWTYLTGVAGDPEAEIIESLLRAYEIPVIKKYREAGGFLRIYMGMTGFGIDLYVPQSSFDTARKLLEEQDDPSPPGGA